MIDFVITNTGTVVLIRAASASAREWVDENVATESWQWIGDAFGVDHRPAQQLVDDIIAGPWNTILR